VDHLRAPPESTRSIGGHLIAHHLLGNIDVGNDAVVACSVAVLHDGLEVFAGKTNLVDRALPQDGHSICGNRELAGALRDHDIDVDLNLCIVNGPIVVVGNDGRRLVVILAGALFYTTVTFRCF
jgi:hypothetical protein